MADLEMKDVAGLVNEIKTAHEEYKTTVDVKLDEMATKGSVDVLVTDKIAKVDETIAALQKTLDEVALSQKRVPKIHLDANGNEVDLDGKALVWAQRIAKKRNEVVTEFTNDNLVEYKTAFLRYVSKGAEALSADERKALSVGSDPDGGYTVTSDMSGAISKKVFETSPMRQYASVHTTSKDAVEGYFDDDEVDTNWETETSTTSDTGTAEVGKWRIPVWNLRTAPRASQNVLDDSDWNIEQWLIDKVSDRMSRAQNTAFTIGSGADRPRGFTTYASGSTSIRNQVQQYNTGVNGGFAATPNGGDVLLDALYGVKSQYRMRGVWFMNSLTMSEVRKLKDSNGAYIWQPGATAGQPASLMGYPVATFEDMADIATGSLSIAFGDMAAAYQIVERQGTQIQRDPFSAKPRIEFYSTQRVGGGLINGEALKLINFQA